MSLILCFAAPKRVGLLLTMKQLLRPFANSTASQERPPVLVPVWVVLVVPRVQVGPSLQPRLLVVVVVVAAVVNGMTMQNPGGLALLALALALALGVRKRGKRPCTGTTTIPFLRPSTSRKSRLFLMIIPRVCHHRTGLPRKSARV
jgi:hypothetical protein